jgi:hypothetical protein
MEVMGLIIRGLLYGVVSGKATMWKICGDVVVIKNGRQARGSGLSRAKPKEL